MAATRKEVEVTMVKPQRGFFRKLSDKRTACDLLVIHLLCLLAPFHFNLAAFFVAMALFFITVPFGISLSYHRNLSHKSFKLPKWLEYSFAYFGVHALQGDPIDWVSTHRYHHQFVDTDRDPHTPVKGFWYGHIAWLFDSYALTKKINAKNVRDYDERDAKLKIFNSVFERRVKNGRPNNVEDLQKQVFYRLIQKTYILHPTALALILYAIGGLPFIVWGMGVRPVCGLHVTFLVNSICHMWGYQPWNTGDLSKNNWVIGFLAFGDGWHNNHHAFEYSARHGLQWWEFDFTWIVILFLEAIGLATDVKLPSEIHKQKLRLN